MRQAALRKNSNIMPWEDILFNAECQYTNTFFMTTRTKKTSANIHIFSILLKKNVFLQRFCSPTCKENYHIIYLLTDICILISSLKKFDLLTVAVTFVMLTAGCSKSTQEEKTSAAQNVMTTIMNHKSVRN